MYLVFLRQPPAGSHPPLSASAPTSGSSVTIASRRRDSQDAVTEESDDEDLFRGDGMVLVGM